MRLVSIFVVIFLGAALLVATEFSDRNGRTDDFGFFMLVTGLIALGVELYAIPILRWFRNRD